MSHLQTDHDAQGAKPDSGQRSAGLLPSIVISALFPLVIYWLASPYMSTLSVLILMAVPPVLYSVYGWIRARRIDLISIITLFTLVVSMVLALLVHDPHLLLLRDSYLTGTFGLLCLLSLMTSKPAAYYVYKWMFVRTPEQLASLDGNWKLPYSRFVRRLITIVWAVLFIGETLTDAFLVYNLPTERFVEIHPFLFWGTLVVAFGGATLYSRQAQKKIASLQQTGPGPGNEQC